MKSTITFICVYCKGEAIFTTDFVLMVATGEYVHINCPKCERTAKYTINEITYYFDVEDKNVKPDANV